MAGYNTFRSIPALAMASKFTTHTDCTTVHMDCYRRGVATHEAEAAERAGRRAWWALGALVLVVLLLAIDGTVLYLAVPALIEDLDPTATEVLWIGDIYSFVLAGLLITMGNLADRIG